MEAFDFSVFLELNVIIAIIGGVLAGMILGALPGLGAVVAIVLVLPLTFAMEPLPAILVLLAVYQAAEYGGSISSIILGIPGTGGAIVTTMDGHPMAKAGKPGLALGFSLTASLIGGLVGGLVLLFLTQPLAEFALRLGPAEFTLIIVLGILAVAALSSDDIFKSLASVFLGMMAATVGTDVFTGAERFTMGFPELSNGFTILSLLVGTFAVPELLTMAGGSNVKAPRLSRAATRVRMPLREFAQSWRAISVGSTIGPITGVVPGLGAGPAAWFAYAASKRFSKRSTPYGKGNPDGVASAESANNGAVGGAVVPILALGIPGSPTTAIIMGAFLIHGINPGPNIFNEHADLAYGILFGFIILTVVMYIVGRFLTPAFVQLLNVPRKILIPVVLLFALVGVYFDRGLWFDVWVALIVGVIAFVLDRLSFSKASFILAFILTPIFESNMRRALLVSGGEYRIFLGSIEAIVIALIIVLIVLYSVVSFVREGRKDKAAAL